MNNKQKQKVKYSICKPAGNDTALVYGTNYDKDQKKEINEVIMKKHSNIEQVGFIGVNTKAELQMAGGEFCGNATRSAAYKYLKGKKGNIQILVNSKDLIIAGVDENKNAWCEIPLCNEENSIVIKKASGVFVIKMNGILIVVVQEKEAKKYLKNKNKLKEIGLEFIKKYNLECNKAVGVMFCEKENGMLKINPVVWVKAINTLFYETACGSGTVAVCMLEAFMQNQSKSIDVVQPSGGIITASVCYNNGEFIKAIISGNIETDGKIYSIEI